MSCKDCPNAARPGSDRCEDCEDQEILDQWCDALAAIEARPDGVTLRTKTLAMVRAIAEADYWPLELDC